MKNETNESGHTPQYTQYDNTGFPFIYFSVYLDKYGDTVVGEVVSKQDKRGSWANITHLAAVCSWPHVTTFLPRFSASQAQ